MRYGYLAKFGIGLSVGIGVAASSLWVSESTSERRLSDKTVVSASDVNPSNRVLAVGPYPGPVAVPMVSWNTSPASSSPIGSELRGEEVVDLRGQTIEGRDYTNFNFGAAVAEGSMLIGNDAEGRPTIFRDCTFNGSIFGDVTAAQVIDGLSILSSRIDGATFRNLSIRNFAIDGSSFEDVDFLQSNLHFTGAANAIIGHSTFEGVRLSGVLRQAVIARVDWNNGVVLEHLDLSDSIISSSDLLNVDFRNDVGLTRTSFVNIRTNGRTHFDFIHLLVADWSLWDFDEEDPEAAAAELLNFDGEDISVPEIPTRFSLFNTERCDNGGLRRSIGPTKVVISNLTVRGDAFAGTSWCGVEFVDADFRGADLSGASFSNAGLVGADFTPLIASRGIEISTILEGTDLSGASLADAKLSDLDLTHVGSIMGADLRGADFSGSDLSELDLTGLHSADSSHFEGADLSGADASGVSMIGASFDQFTHLTERTRLANTNLQYATFDQTDLRYVVLAGARLDEVNFRSANFEGADLTSIGSLARANFEPADGSGRPTRFDKANLEGLHITEASVGQEQVELEDVIGISFKGARLSGAELSGDMRGSDFSGSVLAAVQPRKGEIRPVATFASGTTLEGSKFDNANATGVGFSGLLLRNASFRGATLTGADMTNADLRRANFERAIAGFVKFDGADLFRCNFKMSSTTGSTYVGSKNLETITFS